VQFSQGHSHCTKFGNQTSALREITASIVQGSAIGPASYVHLVIWLPSQPEIAYASMQTIHMLLSLLASPTLVWLNWITLAHGHNNSHLNRVKSVELIVSAPRRRRQFNPPPCIPEIKRVTTLTILGVTITNKLSVSEYVRTVVNSCAQIMHCMPYLAYTPKSRDGWCPIVTGLPCSGCRKTYVCLAPGGVSPLHRTCNALKVFYVAAVRKTCTLLTNPL